MFICHNKLVVGQMLSSFTFLLVLDGFSKKQILLHKNNITGKANKGKVIKSDSIIKESKRSLSTSGVTRKGSILSNKKRKREDGEMIEDPESLKSVTHILVHQTMTFEKLGDILPVSYYHGISTNRIQVHIVKIEWLSACLMNGCVGEVEEFLVKREEEEKEEEEEEDQMDTKLNRYSLWEKDHLLRACPLVSPNDNIVDALREIGEFYQITNETTKMVRYSLTSNLPISRLTFLESSDV